MQESVPSDGARDWIRSTLVALNHFVLHVPHARAAQSPEEKLIKLEHTLRGWKHEHAGRMEMLFHYTSCEVCPPLLNLQFLLPSALLFSSYIGFLFGDM